VSPDPLYQAWSVDLSPTLLLWHLSILESLDAVAGVAPNVNAVNFIIFKSIKSSWSEPVNIWCLMFRSQIADLNLSWCYTESYTYIPACNEVIITKYRRMQLTTRGVNHKFIACLVNIMWLYFVNNMECRAVLCDSRDCSMPATNFIGENLRS